VKRHISLGVAAAVSALALVALSVGPTAAADASAKRKPGAALGQAKHLVVIYEENHSFDNLYGGWGRVNGDHVVGRADATPSHTTQVSQTGSPYSCVMQNDVNLTSPPLGALAGCNPGTVVFPDGTSTSYSSRFTNGPFRIDNFIKPADRTCPPLNNLFAFPNGVDKNNPPPGARAGGCTRDLVHKFYQEIYQLNGGRQNRYVTGSDAVGLSMGFYDTRQLPIYRYLHGRKAPKYVIADHFFQAAFGGSAAALVGRTGYRPRGARQRRRRTCLPALQADRRRGRRQRHAGVRGRVGSQPVGVRRLDGQHVAAGSPADVQLRAEDPHDR
jgi:phospholipase C